MYETTPGEGFKSLPNTPGPATESTSFSRYTFDTSPSLPPPRKASVSCTPNIDPVNKSETTTDKNADNEPSMKKLCDEYNVMLMN